jgi:predicted nucleotidyltransferase
MLHATFQALIDATEAACRRLYGRRLVALAVFGSVARGTQRHDSDIDLLIVARGLPDGRMPRVYEFEAVEQALAREFARAAEAGVHTSLSPVFKTPTELEAGSPLLLDMTDQARLLYDPEEILAGRLERLRQRLRELGSRRVRSGGGYYWLLKPDLKPGETIEL